MYVIEQKKLISLQIKFGSCWFDQTGKIVLVIVWSTNSEWSTLKQISLYSVGKSWIINFLTLSCFLPCIHMYIDHMIFHEAEYGP